MKNRWYVQYETLDTHSPITVQVTTRRVAYWASADFTRRHSGYAAQPYYMTPSMAIYRGPVFVNGKPAQCKDIVN